MKVVSRMVLIVLALGFSAVWAQEDGTVGEVPYVPTPQQVVEGMLKLGGVKAGDIVIDLGCGDGRIVVTAVKQFGAARGTCVDINPERIREAKDNARAKGVEDKITFIESDLFKVDVSPATVLTMYLLPSVNERLKPRLTQMLRPGTRVVSHAFDMPGWKPDKEETIDGRRIFLWTMPK